MPPWAGDEFPPPRKKALTPAERKALKKQSLKEQRRRGASKKARVGGDDDDGGSGGRGGGGGGGGGGLDAARVAVTHAQPHEKVHVAHHPQEPSDDVFCCPAVGRRLSIAVGRQCNSSE